MSERNSMKSKLHAIRCYNIGTINVRPLQWDKIWNCVINTFRDIDHYSLRKKNSEFFPPTKYFVVLYSHVCSNISVCSSFAIEKQFTEKFQKRLVFVTVIRFIENCMHQFYFLVQDQILQSCRSEVANKRFCFYDIWILVNNLKKNHFIIYIKL